MKATGIVRRVEEYGIIGQISKNRINTRDCADFCGAQFAQNPVKIGFPAILERSIIHSNMRQKYILWSSQIKYSNCHT